LIPIGSFSSVVHIIELKPITRGVPAGSGWLAGSQRKLGLSA
jgi:hypothetical protein